MSIYFNVETKEYPRFQGDMELLGWQPGEELPENWVEVTESAIPEYASDEKAVETLPLLVDGVWTQQFEVLPLNAEEKLQRDAPFTAKEKLEALGLNQYEILALAKGFIRF